MQKTVLTKAVAVALATLGAGAAFAQSSVTIYGNIDGAVDNVHKNAGLTPLGTAAASSTLTRVTPSISSQNALGFKGVEDIGGGYKGNFVLEGQFNTDTGAQGGQDSRMWGRQAYVGLTTPVGEVRVGRQYAPIFYNFATSTVEAIGAADLMASGLVVNNLQLRQDNQISYWLKAGDLTAALSYSPNAGVPAKVSTMRAPAATSTTGQIIGGASAGDENNTGRGRTYGLYLNYTVNPELSVNAGYHSNKFGDAAIGYYTTSALGSIPANTYLPLFAADKYVGYALGTKYTIAGTGTTLGAIYHYGKFTNDAGSAEGPKINTLALGVKHPINQFAVGAEVVYSKFANFTKGKDLGVMLAGDYNFSKRTKVYTRIGFVRDTAGNSTGSTDVPGLNIVGGPLPVLTALGSTETPFFAGGSANVDATTRVVSVGIRHSF